MGKFVFFGSWGSHPPENHQSIVRRIALQTRNAQEKPMELAILRKLVQHMWVHVGPKHTECVRTWLTKNHAERAAMKSRMPRLH